MKKFIVALCFIILFVTVPVSFTSPLNANPLSVAVKANDKVAGSIPAPIHSDGTTMIPVVELFDVLGFKGELLTANDTTQARIHYADVVYVVTEGSTKVDMYNSNLTELYQSLTSSKAAILTNKQTLAIPLAFIRERIGLDIEWKEKYNTIVVNMKSSRHTFKNNEEVAHAAYLKVNNTKMMLANYEAFMEVDIDNSGQTYPLVQSGTTLLPVSQLIKELGGQSSWNQTEKKVTLTLNGNKIELKIGQASAIVNGSTVKLSTPAQTINGRTMLPLRFVSESLGLEVYWDQDSSVIILYRPWFKHELEWDSYNYFFWFSNSNDPVYQKKLADQQAAEQKAKEEAERQAAEKAAEEAAKRGNKPYDANFNLVRIGDIVSVGFFDGQVLDINGSKLLVYWDSKSPFIPKGDEEFWAMVAGIRYESSTWIDASEVTISSSGY